MRLKIVKVKWLMGHIKKMTKKEIKFRDPVVERVVDKFVSRSDVGFKKYGTTLHEERTQKVKGLLKKNRLIPIKKAINKGLSKLKKTSSKLLAPNF